MRIKFVRHKHRFICGGAIKAKFLYERVIGVSFYYGFYYLPSFFYIIIVFGKFVSIVVLFNFSTNSFVFVTKGCENCLVFWSGVFNKFNVKFFFLFYKV